MREKGSYMAETIWNTLVEIDHFLSEKIPADRLDMASAFVFYSDFRIYFISGDRTGFP